MTPRMRRLALSTLAVTLVVSGAALPASGAPDTNLASGGNPPGGWIANPEIYQNIFGDPGAGAPQGTIIADSGFRPYPHGFPVPNWGSSEAFGQNALVYGVPTRVTLEQFVDGQYAGQEPLNSLALRRSLGNGVCRDAASIDPRTGRCDLILGAELLAQMIETAALGGHCFGIAAAAAALYNGQIPANQVGASGLGINASNPMGPRATQTITRLFATQYLDPDVLPLVVTGQSPTSIVQTLIETLPGGTVPFVLTVSGSIGGHGITPYAVLDRGNGVYDIAVYDNNFPFRALAVTVDTNTDTFIYTSATDPNSPSYTWSSGNQSAIALIPVTDLLAQQPCPICRGKDQGTLVAFSSSVKANFDAINIGLYDLSNEPLANDLYRVLRPVNPPTEEFQSTPLIVVDPGVEFVVAIQTGKLPVSQPMEVYALSNGASSYLLLDTLPSNSTTLFGVGKDGAIVQSSEASSPRIQQLYDGRTTSYDVNGHPLVLPKNVIATQDWDRAKRKVRYSSTATRSLTWNVQVTGVRDDGEAGWVALGVSVPSRGEILVDYSQASATVAPRAWVITGDGRRTSVPLQPVTETLIEQYRDQIYVTQGPG